MAEKALVSRSLLAESAQALVESHDNATLDHARYRAALLLQLP